MEPYELFVACGPFPPHLTGRVREECRYRVLCPSALVRTDFHRSDLCVELFPESTWLEAEGWEGRAENGYYAELVRGAGGIYTFAAPALADHRSALAALGAACEARGRALTLFLY